MEYVDAIRELKGLPEEIHLFCPRQNATDYDRYDDLTQDNKDEQGRTIKDVVEEATARKQKFLSCMRILAYNADGVEELQSWVLGKLDDTLEKCDLCIMQYYTGKIWLMDKLSQEGYQEEEIEEFSRRIDELDIKRITRNLPTATLQLQSVLPQKIALDTLDRAALLSIFETLSCEAMLKSEDLLQNHFDLPFKLIQTRRALKISEYVPAVTRFLFDSNQTRSFWAISSWTRYTRPPTTLEFEWAIRDALLVALRAASQQPPPAIIIQRLWRGMQLIVKRLDKEQITHQLRALEIDPCRLTVDHLHIPTPGLRYLLNTIQTLLEKAPTVFWDAMQTISPQAIIEHTFHNPQFHAFLMQTADGEPYEKSALQDMLSWISPFLASLKGARQPSACRSLAERLLKSLQDTKYPNRARYYCFLEGLKSLLGTLRIFTDNENSRSSVEKVVLSETMDALIDTIDIILEPPTFSVEQGRQKEISSLCMDVVRNTLALECQSLKSDYEVILKHGTLSHGVSTYSAPIWDAVVRNLRKDNLPLSTSALLAILPLVGLEKFTSKGGANPEKTNFNMIYGHLIHLSCQIIERLSEFPPDHLNILFQSQDTCSALISTLFAADLNTYQTAVDLIKNVSGQAARRDAISYLLESSFVTTMYGISWSLRRISNMKTFAPAPRMLHAGTDIVEILCNDQTGMLRTRNLVDRREVAALQKLWEFLWQALSTIFNETEAWHLRGNEKSVMLEFCRDTIEFANFLFKQYAVFVGAIGDDEKSALDFLKSPTATMSAMVKWLRLKDVFLAGTLVDLVSKLLRRLGEKHVTVKPDALRFIEGVAVDGSVKTILTSVEKAELVRSLESYYKKPIVTASTAALKKQSSITSFTSTTTLSSSSPHHPIEKDLDNVSAITHLEFSRSVELNKARVASSAKTKPKTAPVKPSAPIRRAPTKPDLNAAASFREKREREKLEKKKRDLAEKARLTKIRTSATGQTNEAGSGLKKIGALGKDHTIPLDSMMVSSGSDTDSESEDELDKELFGDKSKKQSTVLEYEHNKKMAFQQQPVKKAKLSIKDVRARLAPDLSSLQHTILGWDYHETGELPPNFTHDLVQVQGTYRDAREYKRVFEPLLLLEAWNGLQRAKEEVTEPFEVSIESRLSVDMWIEFSTKPLSKSDKDKKTFIGEGDVVIFSASRNMTQDSFEPYILARVKSVNYRNGKQEVTYRTNPGRNPYLAKLGPNSKAWGAKVTSLTSTEREYASLVSLEYYDLCSELLMANPSPILKYADTTLQPLVKNYDVNVAQAKAIKSALDNDGFTLIQGPPGSGKTKTITALVGALLTNVLAARGTTTLISKGGVRNAAVDEIVLRLKNGIKTMHGRTEQISVVRLGRKEAVNSKVLDVTLDQMVENRMNTNTKPSGPPVDMAKLCAEHKEICNQVNAEWQKFNECREKGLSTGLTMPKIDSLKKKKAQLSAIIDKTNDNMKTQTRNNDMQRKAMQQEIARKADVICTTLSGSGHDIFQTLDLEFETVIIDEAAQCIEMSAMIPLKYGCSKCVLVGDPKQLPPTVLSKRAEKYEFGQSLFVRMQKNHAEDVHLLDVQYRMHPDISKFPRAAFYDGKLLNGPDMGDLRLRPWHMSELLSPYRFFDVQGMQRSLPRGRSLVNQAELDVAMQLYERLIKDVPGYDFDNNIGIITPYKGQLLEMKSQFARRYGEEILDKVEFNTTDAFQGRECEIIIFSCVRASMNGIGFLDDIRRMNVGLTRAKCSLWVLGNSEALMQGRFWNNLIEDARERKLYTTNLGNQLQKPQSMSFHPLVIKAKTVLPAPSQISPKGQHETREVRVSADLGGPLDRATADRPQVSPTIQGRRVLASLDSLGGPLDGLTAPGQGQRQVLPTGQAKIREVLVSDSLGDPLGGVTTIQDSDCSKRKRTDSVSSESTGSKTAGTNSAGPKSSSMDAPGPPKRMRPKKPVDPFIRPKPRPHGGHK
ncbi:hypothetical protein N7495_007462 [Penicillium taxi]|uniref:uncharacterized protein n=1 Tax=Penicillium taxi TaxID=168475 RepID=UPI002544E27A|nr:uncharacterized protein N7495_007462 [Penicillium taxi]KAJ5887421.1 hypothetical protein N7495_007462 [Penicillium taxi]